MAEEPDLSRTEPASPRRLQQARNEGDVPRSAELTAWVGLLSALGALAWWAPKLFTAFVQHFQTVLQSAAQPFPAEPFSLWLPIAGTLLPILALIFIALLMAPMLLSGWVFAPSVLSFNTQRLHPLLTFKRLFSFDGVFVISRTLLKFALVVGVCWLTLAGEWTRVWALPAASVAESFHAGASLLLQGLLAVVGALTVIAIIDSGWQWWRHRARHAMTWQEVLAEAKESEGSPEMRGRMLGRQQAAAAQASASSLSNPPPEGVRANVMPRTTPLPNSDVTPKHSTKPSNGQVVANLPKGEGSNAEPKVIP